MAYTVVNFKTKKALKEAVADYYDKAGNGELVCNSGVKCYNPGLGPDLSNYTGLVSLEGPHYPEPHSWYARAELKDGVIIKVS